VVCLLVVILLEIVRRLGDMLKSTYDPGENGVVDNSEKLEGSSKASVRNHAPITHTLNSHSLPTGNLNLNSKKIISLADPTIDQDGATKKYVDDLVGIPTPNYDSGFVSINHNQTVQFSHNLDTKDLLVQIFVRTPASGAQTLWGSTDTGYYNSAWIWDDNRIDMVNKWGVTKEFRLLLWKF